MSLQNYRFWREHSDGMWNEDPALIEAETLEKAAKHVADYLTAGMTRLQTSRRVFVFNTSSRQGMIYRLTPPEAPIYQLIPERPGN